MADRVRLFARVEWRHEQPRVRHTMGLPEALSDGQPPADAIQFAIAIRRE